MTATIPRSIITDALYDAGLTDDNLHDGYSGRFMYGAKCFGIVGSATDYTKFMIALATALARDDDADLMFGWDMNDLADAVRTDDMARDTIFYFPGYTIAED